MSARALVMAALLPALAVEVTASGARGDAPVPPWYPREDVPPPAWARSVAPRVKDPAHPGDLVLFADPARTSGRRGVTVSGASLPFFGARRGGGCSGAWWLVGPLAWTCSDDAELSADEPSAPPLPAAGDDGLAARYYFVGKDGAGAYASLEAAQEGSPDRELEGGWGVAAVEQRSVAGEPWVRTTKGLWIAGRDLAAARPSTFQGAVVEAGRLDMAWVIADRAGIWPAPSAKSKAKAWATRLQRVRVRDTQGTMVGLDDGTWMQARDLARPSIAPPPPEVTGRTEAWVDVELSSQTLVAYRGPVPVYATLVSTGRAGVDETPPGVHRIWVKILTSDMGNSAAVDAEAHYALEEVPYVQFFDHAVALHGTYWHRDFGRSRSHGCVNLAPLDARWLFDFTGPRLPPGWTAAYPTSLDDGSVVRVR